MSPNNKDDSHITDKEILDWTSDENSKHIMQRHTLELLVGRILKLADVFPDGSTLKQVREMSPFRQIQFLERLAENDDFAWGALKVPELSREISLFVEEVDKRDFRTTSDF